MSLISHSERFFDVASLKEGESDYVKCVSLRVGVANGDHLPSLIVVNRDLEKVFAIAFNSGHLRSVEAEGRRRMKAVQAPYSTQWEPFSCV